jgi:hypothetical protein
MIAGDGANLADIVEALLQVVLIGDEFQRTNMPTMRAWPTMGWSSNAFQRCWK